LLSTRAGKAMCTVCCNKACSNISDLTKRRTALSAVFPSLSPLLSPKTKPRQIFCFRFYSNSSWNNAVLNGDLYTNKCTRMRTNTHLQATDRRWIKHTHTHTHTVVAITDLRTSRTNRINILVTEPKAATQHPRLLSLERTLCLLQSLPVSSEDFLTYTGCPKKIVPFFYFFF
jgi:hypothetical protein